MKRVFETLRWSYKLSGFNWKKLSRNVRALPYYLRTYSLLKAQAAHSDEPFRFGPLYPTLDDRYAQAGTASGHYFHQDLYVARKIHANNPRRHIDIGSRVDGFVAHVASFRPIEVIDVRPLESHVANMHFLCADMMGDLPDELVASTDSLSCLHAIEHFGLGRYGDPVNFDGHVIGLKNMRRMVQPGGKLYLSTPISREQRIEFNAHRVFSIPYLKERLTDGFTIDSFACVDDQGQLRENCDLDSPEAKDSFHFKFGCGIFELTRKAA